MQSKWEDYYKNQNYFHLEPHEYLPAFASKCRASKVTKIIDFGCGAGADILYLAEQGFEVEGVDFSPAAVMNAEDLLQVKGFTGKVYVDNLFDSVGNYPPQSISAAACINSLEYTDIETFKSTLTEISRMLSENGLLLLVVSSKESEVTLQTEEQIFFTAEELENIVKNRFSILDFTKDSKQNLVMLLSKINR